MRFEAFGNADLYHIPRLFQYKKAVFDGEGLYLFRSYGSGQGQPAILLSLTTT
jgi:hypothetical protein